MVSLSISRGNVRKLFPTPVITDTLPKADALNAALERTILSQRERDPGHSLSNRGGWQSEHDFARWGKEEGAAVIRAALELADAHTAGTPKRWAYDAWANVSGPGHFNMPHMHAGTFWSAVYYVRVGEGEGGELVLHDPRLPGSQMHAPHLRLRGTGPDYRALIAPAPGMMVLFPAWLSHSVEPWQGTGQRISIAMNIRAIAPHSNRQD